MNIGDHYVFVEFLKWTRRKVYWLILVSVIITAMYRYLEWYFLAVPWVPIALVGTAAAFIVGFRNTQTYNRVWEARTLWGAIVNSSRTLGIMTRDFVRHNDKEKEAALRKEIIYRHVAWLTALRFQLREVKSWENIKTRSYNLEYLRNYKVPEWCQDLPTELSTFLKEDELTEILRKKNKAAQLIAAQSQRFRQLNEEGIIDTLCYVELENVMKDLYSHQGGCERIKNFPYPRQFASINLFFIRLLVILLPLGMLNEFARLGGDWIWLNVPFAAIVGWVFISLEQVGEATENPFEGGPNDVPITSLTRTIEIDLREMLGETELPAPIGPIHEIVL
ncbi:MAG: multidrug transporter [Chitinophagaceae bacterium]|nr:MAG: multidrug transporter [Chitinophagaceae bacterium]